MRQIDSGQRGRPIGSSERIESRVAGVRVVRWDEYHFGIQIDFTDKSHVTYPVGTRIQAIAEAAAVRTGKRKPALLQDKAR
jgi:hypothetical protein